MQTYDGTCGDRTSIKPFVGGRSVLMASASFRESMNSMGWSRRDPDVPVRTNSSTPILSRLQRLNPFGDSGYVRLPTHDGPPGAPLPAPSRREEEEGFFAREYSNVVFIYVCSILAISAIDRPLAPA